MDTSIREAVHIATVNPRIHTLIVSGAAGVGKSSEVRRILQRQGIAYRVMPVHIQAEQLGPQIDMERSIQSGKAVMDEGILASGPRCRIVDDIQLLAPDVRHYILSKAAELDLLIIGTVNTSEGELTDEEWALVDMHVSVLNPTLEQRVQVMRRVLGTGDVLPNDTTDMQMTSEMCGSPDEIAVSEAIMTLAVAYAEQAGTEGHTAEWLLLEVAKGLAVLEDGTYCKPVHVEKAALYVLPHRMRGHRDEQQPEEQSSDTALPDIDDDTSDTGDDTPDTGDDRSDSGEDVRNTETKELEQGADVSGEPNETDEPDSGKDSDVPDSGDNTPERGDTGGSDSSGHKHTRQDVEDVGDVTLPEQVARIKNELFRLTLETGRGVDRYSRKGAGRRWLTKTKERKGRYTRSRVDEQALEDLALDATIRAAAPYQRWRRKSGTGSLAVHIERSDYRRKEREKRTAGYYLFVVDASGSMAAKQRMEAAKGAVMSMLRDTYTKRDVVGLIAFRKDRAEVLLPFTSSVERAQRLLNELPTGGRTPLGEGLRTAYGMCRQVLQRYPHEKIHILLITDGRATWGVTDDPVDEARQWARAVSALPVQTVVIDTEQGFVRLGLAEELCGLMRGHYYSMDALTEDTILKAARR